MFKPHRRSQRYALTDEEVKEKEALEGIEGVGFFPNPIAELVHCKSQ